MSGTNNSEKITSLMSERMVFELKDETKNAISKIINEGIESCQEYLFSLGKENGAITLFDTIQYLREYIMLLTYDLDKVRMLEDGYIDKFQELSELIRKDLSYNSEESKRSIETFKDAIKEQRNLLFYLEKLFTVFDQAYSKNLGLTKKEPKGLFNQASEAIWVFRALNEIEALPLANKSSITTFIGNSCELSPAYLRTYYNQIEGEPQKNERIDNAINVLEKTIEYLKRHKKL